MNQCIKYLTSLLLLFGYGYLPAQFIYFTADLPGTSNDVLWRIDPNTCAFCPVLDHNEQFVTETLILPGGDVLIMSSGGIFRYDPPSNTPIATIPNVYTGGFVHPNGTIYLNNVGVLYTFDPATNTTTFVGNFPPNYAVYELFFYNGQLYGVANFFSGNVQAVILQINLVNPAASIQVQSMPNYAATSAPDGTIYVEDGFTPVAIYTYNFTTNTVTPVCTGLGILGNIRGLTVAPPGTPELDCICVSYAGTPAVSAAQTCVPNALNVAFNNNAGPDYNDVVRYILYTDPNNPLGTILQNNPNPTFTFTSPIQADVTYYVSQIVGNNLNGMVDPLDPCLKISTTVPVVWHPKPVLVALSSSGDLCAGSCQSINITLQGNPPFIYFWQVQQGGNVITPLQGVLNINAVTSTFQACVPANASAGPVQVVICSITDAFCTSP